MPLWSTQEAPWIDDVLLPIGSLSATYQHFSQFRIGNDRICCYPGEGLLLEAGLFFAPTPDWSGELETRVTQTHAHSLSIDQFKQTVRYMLSDDARGDCFASSLGLSLIQPITTGLNDPSLIHHGHFEIEAHFAIGKEWSSGPDWIYRTYALAAFGAADIGSPWMRGKLVFLKNTANTHIFSIQVEAEKGFGHRTLSLHHFHGYGSIDYAFIDISMSYARQFNSGLTLGLKLLQRLLSRNAPDDLSQIRLELTYPFSL
jgi:hypothetical protein